MMHSVELVVLEGHCHYVNSRLKTAEDEMKAVPCYDYVVINDEVENAVERLKAVLKAEKCRTVRMNNN